MSTPNKNYSGLTMLVPVLGMFACGVQAAEQLTLTKVIPADQQRQALEFFTRETMAATPPMVMPIDYGPAEVDQSAAIVPELLGRPGDSPAGAAARGANKVARAAYPSDWMGRSARADKAALELPAGTSQVYDYYNVNDWAPAQTIYPHKWIGRLSFRTPGGTSYCSATSISGNNFVTAAHCVYDTTNNRFYSTWVFTPAYRAGSAPYGSFSATLCTVLTAWVNLSGGFSINSWSRYDVAVCTAGRNTAGQTLNTAVGWAGRQWNYGYVRHYFDLGYPWNNYLNQSLGTTAGWYLRTCAGESFAQTTDTLGLGCYWGPGISGGPWLAGYKQNVITGWVNGDNSGLFIGTQNLYGPRYTSSNIVPLCTARGC